MSALAILGSVALVALGPWLASAHGDEASAATLALVGLSIATAAFSVRSLDSESLSLGALSALFFAGLNRLALPLVLSTSALFAALHLARALRGRRVDARNQIVVLAALGGLSASWLASALAPSHLPSPFDLAALWDLGTALACWTSVVLLASLPFALPVDDAIAYELRDLARRQRRTARTKALRAAALRRRMQALAGELDADLLRPFESTFRSVIALFEARLQAHPPAAAFIDIRLDRRLRRIRDALKATSMRAALLHSVEQAHASNLDAESEALRNECEALLQLDEEAPPAG